MSEQNKNLVLWEKIRSCPIEAQKKIGGGKLTGMTDISPIWRIKTLTEQYGVCGIGWYYDITERQVFEGAGGEKVVHVEINLFVKDGDAWSKPIQGVGGSELIKTEKGKLVTNDEAFKMALTDALSVSCKSLGMAADIYWDKDKTKYTTEDIEFITSDDKDTFETLGISESAVAIYFKVPVDKITHKQALQAIDMQIKANEKARRALSDVK
jgi:hypothetical protein